MRPGGWVLFIARLGLAGLAALGVLPSSVDAQDSGARSRPAVAVAPYRFRVLGVFDAASGRPIADADVLDVLTGASARTSRTGTVALSFLPDGGGLVRIRKLGYAMRTMMVAISPADTAPMTVVLQHAVQLPGVTTYGKSGYISPNLRGFEERRLHGATGYFIPDSVLRKEESHPLSSVLEAHIPGINILYKGRSTLLGPSDRCIGAAPDVYVDGVRVLYVPPLTPALLARLKRTGGTLPTSGTIDLTQFDVTNLAGVEYYPDNAVAPLQFPHTTKGCGALFLWTREK